MSFGEMSLEWPQWLTLYSVILGLHYTQSQCRNRIGWHLQIYASGMSLRLSKSAPKFSQLLVDGRKMKHGLRQIGRLDALGRTYLVQVYHA